MMWSRLRRLLGGMISFGDYVRNPALRHGIAESFEARDRAVKKLVHESPQELVAMLLDDDRYRLAERAIPSAGQRVVPALIDAISDPRYRRPKSARQPTSLRDLMNRRQPLETVLNCLAELAPNNAIRAIAPLVNDKDEEIRKHAALAVGAIGTDEAVALLETCCRDEDAYVRCFAMMGVLRALDADRISDGFRKGAFRAIEPLVYRGDNTTGGEAPRCLLRLDRERAASLLTSPMNLDAERERLHEALRELRDFEVTVDERALLSIESAVADRADEYPFSYVLCEILQLLARIDSDAARRAITRNINSGSREVRTAAAHALAASRGIKKPFEFAFARLSSRGWSGITGPQRQVLVIRELIDEVCNGGFMQYFANSSGSRWRDALAALKEIGAEKDHALLKRAAAIVGPEGPSNIDDDRHLQLSRVSKTDMRIFSPLEAAFYQDERDREVLLLRYIIQHPSDFGAPTGVSNYQH